MDKLGSETEIHHIIIQQATSFSIKVDIHYKFILNAAQIRYLENKSYERITSPYIYGNKEHSLSQNWLVMTQKDRQ